MTRRISPVILIGLALIISLALTAGAQYQESPVLAERVAAGELPPVEERLPDNPFVVGPGVLIVEEDLDWEVGRYGGTLRVASKVANWQPDIFIGANEPLIMAPGIGLDGMRGNIVEDFQVSDDNRVFTFTLRKGLKWSDGVPVTTEDILFAWDDVMSNTEITPMFPRKFRSGGSATAEPMQLDIIDDFTFTLTSEVPYGGLLRDITVAGWVGYTELLKPKHHLVQFHADYTSLEDMAEALAEEELEPDEWGRLFSAKDSLNWHLTRPQAIGFPSLYPWIRVEGPGGMMIFERNPYYFRVDIEGNQLPYIDRIESYDVSDTEAEVLRVITGEIDLLREGTALSSMPLYAENAERAGFRVVVLDMHVDSTALFFNLTYDDPVWREVAGDPRFRLAVSHAIDRQEVIDTVYYGFAEFPELHPSEFDPDQANALLDEMGLDQRSSEGWRLGPDGKPVHVVIENGAHAPDIVPVTELLADFMQDVGIRTDMRTISPELYGQRGGANELQASVIWSVQPMWREGTWTDYLPTSNWGREWAVWYNTGGTSGEEPPPEVKRIYEIHEGRAAAVPYSEEDLALTEELYELYYENVFFINVVEQVGYPLIVNANLGNVPHAGQAIAANYAIEQMFYRE